MHGWVEYEQGDRGAFDWIFPSVPQGSDWWVLGSFTAAIDDSLSCIFVPV